MPKATTCESMNQAMVVGAWALAMGAFCGTVGCAGASNSGLSATAASTSQSIAPAERAALEAQLATLLDDWHAAAASADEARYFGHLADDSIFLGTDAKERWTKPEFLAFAHPFFAKGKAWSFRATARHVTVSEDGRLAWFDETLATPNLGPARGSGVLRRGGEGAAWKIVHYDLSLTIPNERLAAVKKAVTEGSP
jgi:ketosteroid isomerase-like protein